MLALILCTGLLLAQEVKAVSRTTFIVSSSRRIEKAYLDQQHAAYTGVKVPLEVGRAAVAINKVYPAITKNGVQPLDSDVHIVQVGMVGNPGWGGQPWTCQGLTRHPGSPSA